MHDDARIEIATGFLKQPIAQTARRMLGASGDAQLRYGHTALMALHDVARRALAGEHEPVQLAAQRQQCAVAERHALRHAIEPRANPFDIAVEEGAGFAEVALHGKRHDHGAARAADTQRQAPCGRMPANLDGAVELGDARTLRVFLFAF